MPALDRVMQLQAQGVNDTDITKKLRDEGISLQDINDALGQAKIKEAVSQDSDFNGMQQSIMTNQPSTPDDALPAQQPQMQGQDQQQYDQQQYYPDQQYAAQLDTETITEIADQVVSEKFSDFTKKTGDLVALKNETQDKIKDLDERLRRIETSIENLQRSIIGKVGEYGQSMAFVQKDLETIHDTMGKMMNPLIDNYKELQKLAGKR